MAKHCLSTFGTKYISSLNKSYQYDHDGDHKQNMNESAHGVGGDQSQQP